MKSTKDLESELGREVRRLRLLQDLTQQQLADDANVSLSALKNLEAGRGSRVRTLIQVARAMGRTDWMESFTPRESSISPMKMLRQRQEEAARTRKRASRIRDPKVTTN